MGSIDSNISQVDALELGRAIVKIWGGEFLTLSTPAFVSPASVAVVSKEKSAPPWRSATRWAASTMAERLLGRMQ